MDAVAAVGAPAVSYSGRLMCHPRNSAAEFWSVVIAPGAIRVAESSIIGEHYTVILAGLAFGEDAL